ncbi:MAG: type II secretion system protein, partial [Burkholderiales bacterium]
MLKQKEKPIAIKLEIVKSMQDQANAQRVKEIVMAKKFRATAPQVRVKQQGGFTAIELLFALGIIAIATVVIVRAMSSNSDKAHAQQML